VIAGCNHDAVTFWYHSHDGLEATAGSHGILHEGIKANLLQRTVGSDIEVVIYALPDALDGVNFSLFRNGLVRPSRINLIRSFSI
jgi:hypothetical protein